MPPGQFRRVPILEPFQSRHAKEFPGPGLIVGPPKPKGVDRQQDVAQDAAPGGAVAGDWNNHADARLAAPRMIWAVDQDRPFGRIQDAEQDLQDVDLPQPLGLDDRDERIGAWPEKLTFVQRLNGPADRGRVAVSSAPLDLDMGRLVGRWACRDRFPLDVSRGCSRFPLVRLLGPTATPRAGQSRPG